MVNPGVTTRNRLANVRSYGAWTLLIACHAVSIAMTTVLPVPVAIFSATLEALVVLDVCSSSALRAHPAWCLAAASSRKLAVSAASRVCAGGAPG